MQNNKKKRTKYVRSKQQYSEYKLITHHATKVQISFYYRMILRDILFLEYQ